MEQFQEESSTSKSQTSQNGDLWKQFGRESDVGKMLYSMYSAKEKPQIYYPPVRTKPRQASLPKEEKKCPQKTQIEYPEPKKKVGRKYHPIDFIPKRKAGEEILAEIQEEMNKPLQAPKKRGVDRKKMITELQEKFQFKNNEEMEAYFEKQRQLALLPPVENNTKKKRRKYNMGIAQKALQHYQEKYGKPPGDILNMRPKTNEEIRNEQDEELEDLFDSVIEEIEERQEHLEKVIAMGGKKDIEQRLKNEIVARVAELQKIRELQNKFSQ